MARPQLNKRTSNAAHMDDEDDTNMDMDSYVDRNFNEYNDNSADHIGITDDDISQPPIAKGLPTKFMFRGMRGQRQYDVPQIGMFNSIFKLFQHLSNNPYRISITFTPAITSWSKPRG